MRSDFCPLPVTTTMVSPAAALQHFVGSGHLGGFGTGIEQAALFFVNALHFVGRGIAVPITLGEDVDGGIAGSSFVHIGFLLGHVESELGADFAQERAWLGMESKSTPSMSNNTALGVKVLKPCFLNIN